MYVLVPSAAETRGRGRHECWPTVVGGGPLDRWAQQGGGADPTVELVLSRRSLASPHCHGLLLDLRAAGKPLPPAGACVGQSVESELPEPLARAPGPQKGAAPETQIPGQAAQRVGGPHCTQPDPGVTLHPAEARDQHLSDHSRGRLLGAWISSALPSRKPCWGRRALRASQRGKRRDREA